MQYVHLGESFSSHSTRQESIGLAGVSLPSPRSPREEAGPLKGSPVSVRLRPGARPVSPHLTCWGSRQGQQRGAPGPGVLHSPGGGMTQELINSHSRPPADHVRVTSKPVIR
jgi:hypothetical protein